MYDAPVEVIHSLEIICNLDDTILEFALSREGYSMSVTKCGKDKVYVPRTVIRPSSSAPKLDIKGLKETI